MKAETPKSEAAAKAEDPNYFVLYKTPEGWKQAHRPDQLRGLKPEFILTVGAALTEADNDLLSVAAPLAQSLRNEQRLNFD